MSEPELLLSGLGIPESPRWHDGRLWFCNWIDRQVVAVDMDGEAEVMQESVSLSPAPRARSPLDVLYSITYFANATDPVSATPIEIRSGDRVTADLVLMPAPAIHLKVRCSGECEGESGSAIVLQSVFPGHTLDVARGTPTVTAEGEKLPGVEDVAVAPGPSMFLAGTSRRLPIAAADGA